MDLASKLRQMGAVEAARPRPESAESDLGRIISGQVLENEAGACYEVTRRWPMDHVHGRISLDGLGTIGEEAFATAGRDAALHGLKLERALFIDTETTGLAGGAGTVPFLVGLGWIEDGHFVVHQYFMRDYADEGAVLTAIAEKAGEFDWLVSYNGKSYDLSLLASRFVLNRRKNPFEGMAHWDLLHAARRFWRLRLPECSLGSVESHILGFTRQGDVPGYLIPQRYFDYLRDKKSLPLEPVFSHNQLDIVSLLAVAKVLGLMVSDPDRHMAHGEDWLAMARLHEQSRDWPRCASAYEKALSLGIADHLEPEVRWQKSLSHKRAGQWEEALALWRELSRQRQHGVMPYEEAAKYFEHRINDYEKARLTVQAALDRLNLRHELGRSALDEEARERLEYRLARLERKLKGEEKEEEH